MMILAEVMRSRWYIDEPLHQQEIFGDSNMHLHQSCTCFLHDRFCTIDVLLVKQKRWPDWGLNPGPPDIYQML